MSQLDVLHKCDYVLLDQQMPGLNGLETYQCIRKHDAELPICFISGYTTSEDVSQVVHDDPACESMAKPFRVRELIASVGRAVGETHDKDSMG